MVDDATAYRMCDSGIALLLHSVSQRKRPSKQYASLAHHAVANAKTAKCAFREQRRNPGANRTVSLFEGAALPGRHVVRLLIRNEFHRPLRMEPASKGTHAYPSHVLWTALNG